MAAGPNFQNTPNTETALISAANSNRDGSGTIVHTSAAPNQGRLVSSIRVTAIGTTTAGNVKVFVDDGTGGVGHDRLYTEIAIAAATPSATVLPEIHDITLPTDGLPLPSGYRLGFAPANAESFHITIVQGNL